jgi:superfamily II DNA or RNA helicase
MSSDIYYKNYQDLDFDKTLNKLEFSMHKSENKRKHVYQEPSQLLMRNFISKNTIYDNILLYHNVGVGKCHAKDTPIIMYDGNIKKVQDIKIGDLIMGDDSQPRKVLSLARGTDAMYDVIPTKGEKYRVNEEHILCLKASGYPSFNFSKINSNFNIQWIENNKFHSKSFSFNKNNKIDKKLEAEQFYKSITNEQILEISIKDYIKLSETKKKLLKGYKVPINFSEKQIPIDPYMIGYWLGDGGSRGACITSQESTVLHYFVHNLGQYNLYLTKLQSKYCYGISGLTGKKHSNIFLTTLKNLNMINNKHIPIIYKCNSRENRLKLLAGLIDSDGYCTRGGFELVQSIEHEKLIDDVIYLARSLGFACYKTKKSTSWTYNGIKKYSYAWRIFISGKGIEEIPTLIPRKTPNPRRQKKDVLVTGITVEYVNQDNYYGFTLDGNCRYVMGDFTVTHNTCTAITIAEGFKEYIHNIGKKIFVLVKNKNIQQNFIDELLSKCTYDEYLIEGETSDIDILNAKKNINKYYQFMTYGTFVNKVLGAKEFIKDEFGKNTKKVKKINGIVQRKPIQDAIQNLNNTVVIVDEVHNITNNDTYTSLFKVLSNSYNYRLVLLTATPIYDNPKEIFELSNLLNINEPKLQLPTRDKLFEGKEPFLIKEKSEYINTSALKGGIIKITDKGLTALKTSLYGKVSYLKANTETNPSSSIIGQPLIENQIGTTNIVYCEMSKYQYKIYLNALKTDLNKDSKFDISSAIQNIESEENTLENEIISKTNSLYKNTSDASTMSYPNSEYGKTGFLNIFNKSGTSYSLKKEFKNVLTTDLQQYSNKLYTLLQNINKSTSGNIFIYSNYVSYGGTSLIKQLLLANGFVEFSSKSNFKEYKSFIVFDESTNIIRREKFKNIFNSEDNKDGKFIRIIIGSPIISEGITLKGVRQVHILEPYWNMSKINQIIGRAIRNYSHHFLEPSDRTVEIYKYVSVYKSSNEKLDTKKLENFFIDLEKYILCEEKDRSNKIIERLLKTLSFDCVFNYTRNKITDNQSNTPECDYTDCEYQCLINPTETSIDKSTYNMYISFFEQFDIHFILDVIRNLFKTYFVWSLDDIIKKIHHLEPLITEEAIYTTLNYIVQNRINMIDKYDREGFIINKGPYYIFNESNLDIESSLYSKILDFSVNKNKYTLEEFTKQVLDKNLFKKPEDKVKSKEKSKQILTENILSKEDIEYNQNIENTWDIYGTYRSKKMKADKWEHKYGALDNKFRLNIKSDIDSDQRKVTTGKWIGSYNISELRNIAIKLGIPIIESWQKEDFGEAIENFLKENNRIIR